MAYSSLKNRAWLRRHGIFYAATVLVAAGNEGLLRPAP